MKKILFTVFLTLLVSFAFSQTKEDIDLLMKTDLSTNFSQSDFSADYQLVQDIPGQGKNITSATMYRRDKTGAYTILITGPANEKGKGYLQYDATIWFFDPADKRFTFTSAKDKFQNTNAQPRDFAPQNMSTQYNIEKAEKVKLGSYACTLFTLSAKIKDIEYPRVLLWVTTDDGLIRKKEEYSLSGQLLRTTAIPSYQRVMQGKTERHIPVSMLIVDNLRGKKIDNSMQYEKTQITIKNVSFQNQSDIVFTKNYLELMSK